MGKKIGERLVGFDIVEERMQDSLLAIGQTITTWPQLGTAALLNGAATAPAARNILTNRPVVQNRAILSLNSWLTPDYTTEQSIKARTRRTEQFTKQYDQKINEFLNMIQAKAR